MSQVMQAHVSKPGLPTDLIPGFLYADHVFVLGSRGGGEWSGTAVDLPWRMSFEAEGDFLADEF